MRYLPILRLHMPELDTIRGLAILGVLLYHGLYWVTDLSIYTPWQRRLLTLAGPGQFGVNLFFVLSGFLITGILVDSRNRPDYYNRFYFRRALRILPAYYATLLILVLFGLTSRGFLFMSLLYSSNLSLLFGIVMAYPVLWSLAVEEHFYFLWPTVVRRISSAKLAWISGFILVLSPFLRFVSFHLGEQYPFIRAGCSYYTWNTLDGLALGALIALFVRRPACNRVQLLRLAVFLSAFGVLLALAGYPFGITSRMTALGEALQWVPWNLCFGAILSIFLLVGTSPWRKLVAPRFLVFLGSISYGLYLYHLLVFQTYPWMLKQVGLQSLSSLSPWGRTWTRMFVVSGISISIAYLSRWYFEEPFLRLKDSVFAHRIVSKLSDTPKTREPAELASIELETKSSDSTSRLQ